MKNTGAFTSRKPATPTTKKEATHNEKGFRNEKSTQYAIRQKGTFVRLLKYLFKYYGWQIIIMCITLLMVSAGMLVGNVYMQKLIDDVITPALSQNMPWSEASVLLVRMGATMVLFFVLGVIGSVVNNQLNAIITQGTLYHSEKICSTIWNPCPLNISIRTSTVR